jgi:hypothetical protein
VTNTILAVLVCFGPSVSAGAAASEPNAPGTRVLVLAYSPGVMGRVMQRHQDARYPGDFVPGFTPRQDVQGFTAVNWSSRWMLARNVVLTVDVYSPLCGCTIRERWGVGDWQKRKDATIEQRLEVDGRTAARLGFAGSATHARIVRIEVPK